MFDKRKLCNILKLNKQKFFNKKTKYTTFLHLEIGTFQHQRSVGNWNDYK